MSESWTDEVARRRLREAQERGDFDDLPLAGMPLDLGDPHDPDWWVKRYLRENGVTGEDLLPAPLALRREAERLDEAVADVPTEAAVREIGEDFNRRVRLDWLTPTPVPMPHARVVDVDDLVTRWRAARRPEPPPDEPSIPPSPNGFHRFRRWWRFRRLVGGREDEVLSPRAHRPDR